MSEENKNQPSYIVWDIREIITVCNEYELNLLNNIIERIQKLREGAGKRAATNYVVVSEDDPYFKTVADLVTMLKPKEEK